MLRRTFLKAVGAVGAACLLPWQAVRTRWRARRVIEAVSYVETKGLVLGVPIAPGRDRLLIVMGCSEAADLTLTCADAALTLLQRTAPAVAYYVLNPPVGLLTVTANHHGVLTARQFNNAAGVQRIDHASTTTTVEAG